MKEIPIACPTVRILLRALGLEQDDFVTIEQPLSRPGVRVLYLDRGTPDKRLDAAVAATENVLYRGARVVITRLALSLLLTVSAVAQTDAELHDLFRCVVQVESGGDASAQGKHGERGVAQITKIMLDDVNRIAGTRLTFQDVLTEAGAWFCFRVYARHYSPGLSLETIARRWNGGPRGERKAATAAYWAKVRRHLTGARR